MRQILQLWPLACLLVGCAQEVEQVFSPVDAAASGLYFANDITENDTFNILDFEFVYNGGGVAAGDLNGDGLADLYFTGNTTANGLFLNQGDLRFADVTEAAGAGLANRWCSGATTVDVNADGRLDLYVSATTLAPASRRRNALLINLGNDENGTPRFEDRAAAYGLDHDGHNTQAAFLDYDRDGDLDVYLLIDEMINRNLPNRYLPIADDGSNPLNDRLLRNDPGPDGHPVFTDVTQAAGIRKGGYGLGINVCDLNEDGWPDIYVTNDYLTNDLLWINNQDGTFTDRAAAYFKHTAYSAMGNDVADLNGDGHDDLIALDMFPEDNP
ncbi:MAG: VCBS repeat-containing protein, partial [Bacteroidota bacterium]